MGYGLRPWWSRGRLDVLLLKSRWSLAGKWSHRGELPKKRSFISICLRWSIFQLRSPCLLWSSPKPNRKDCPLSLHLRGCSIFFDPWGLSGTGGTCWDQDDVGIPLESIDWIEFPMDGGIDFGYFCNSLHFGGELSPLRTKSLAVSAPRSIEF